MEDEGVGVSGVEVTVSDVESIALQSNGNNETNGHDKVPTCSENGEAETKKEETCQQLTDSPESGMTKNVSEIKEANIGEGHQQALLDVGSRPKGESHAGLPRKSLLKRPNCDTSSSSTFNPPKRIRIVENLESSSGNASTLPSDGNDDENPEILIGADDSASITEVVSCCENLTWLNSPSSHIDQSSINVEFVRDNLSPVKRSFSVEIDMRFILTETCTAILNSKSSIAVVGASEFDIWINRHSICNDPKLKCVRYKENFVKLANIDAVLGYDLTSPKELISKTVEHVEENKVYYVAEIWYNSKGFREYLLWKTGQMEKDFSTKIFAMRTRGPYGNEAKIKDKIGLMFPERSSVAWDEEDFNDLSPENVESHNPCAQTRDILDIEIINSYSNFIYARTDGKGLHTFIADNPEVCHVYESCREIRFQKFFYCECLLALRCLREGGTFLCKIFDTFTLFTNGLLFLLYKCFKSIAIHKPSCSSPCSSERFVICKGKLDNADSKYVVDYLSDCFDMVVNKQEQRKIIRRRVRKRLTVLKMEVQRLVPLRLILSHAEFFQFVRESNIRLTTKLAEAIDELCTLMEQNDEARLMDFADCLNEAQQSKLALWSIPNEDTYDLMVQDQVKQLDAFVLKYNIPKHNPAVKEVILEDLMSSPSAFNQDFVAFPVQRNTKGNIFKSTYGLFFGCGESKVFFLHNSSWCPLVLSNFSLPSGTIVLGEISEEIIVVEGTRDFIPSFHIFDAIFIRGTYIGSLPLKSRQAILTRFLTTVQSASYNTNCDIVPPLNLGQLTAFYESTQATDVMGYCRPIRCYSRGSNCVDSGYHALSDAFMIIRSVEDMSPSNFISRLDQHVLLWNKDEETMKSCFQHLGKFSD